MTAQAPRERDFLYRLRGTIDGREHVFDLEPGEHRVGSRRANDVRLPAEGISRQHAILTVTATGLLVEDCGSKNGTFIGEDRVERAGVEAGAELRFGPVRLRVEALDVDARLAIRFEAPASPTPPSLDVSKTPLVDAEPDSSRAGAWMVMAEGFLGRLEPATSHALHRALAYLVKALVIDGGMLVAWRRGCEPLSLASSGEIHELPPADAVEKLGPPGDAEGECRNVFYATQPPLSAAFHFRHEGPTAGLVLWGQFPGRLSSGAFLRTLVRAVSSLGLHLEDEDVPEIRSTFLSDLVFPEGYWPGTSSVMIELYERMRALRRGRLSVLIHGETGVGKELIARILHASSDRAEGPFVAVNCAAIPQDLLEAEMFGIGKGVATGVEKRPGHFQHAEGGTLFLDEVGELAPALQPKLLRALQEKEIHPVGGRPRKIDVRVVSATNADLEHQLADQGLRRDLYYRLAGGVLEVPPLRSRRDDVAGLVSFCLRRQSEEAGVRLRGVTAGAVRRLRAYDWPGNVRELEHEMQRLAYKGHDGAVIDVEDLDPRIRSPGPKLDVAPAELESLELVPRLEALERALIREAMLRSGGRQVDAARLLGISRNGLAKKLKRMGLKEGWALEDRES